MDLKLSQRMVGSRKNRILKESKTIRNLESNSN